ncbi:Superoxide dismutase [Mn], mitochondrial [Smittium culicis]|uniref:Superoxide dismutase n=1 Tax=Smittium culicis TaxID=133412 RepID=A0A1R1X099_9FUNG|nr:Superoxide dismutase [Mn], mitochondrial [Smittium culicis]
MSFVSSKLLLSRSGSRLAASHVRSKHTLPQLDYAYSELSPVWSEEIVKNHHTGNHQAYVNNLNAAELAISEAIATGDTKKTAELYKAIRFNAGGHLNHTFLWKVVTPLAAAQRADPAATATALQAGTLRSHIEKSFGSIDGLIANMNAQTAAIQGSGWGWLAVNKASGNIEIITTPNQDNPIYYNYDPIFGIDAWEHAFYLDYKTAKAEYFKQIWRIANWNQIQLNYEAAMSSLKK